MKFQSQCTSLVLLSKNCLKPHPGREGGLMVSALDSGSGGPGSSPGRGTALCSWARYFTLIQPSKLIFFLSGHLATDCSSLVASEKF